MSTAGRKYYYCFNDPAWRSLAPANLVWFNSEDALRAAYPGLTLHAPCGL